MCLTVDWSLSMTSSTSLYCCNMWSYRSWLTHPISYPTNRYYTLQTDIIPYKQTLYPTNRYYTLQTEIQRKLFILKPALSISHPISYPTNRYHTLQTDIIPYKQILYPTNRYYTLQTDIIPYKQILYPTNWNTVKVVYTETCTIYITSNIVPYKQISYPTNRYYTLQTEIQWKLFILKPTLSISHPISYPTNKYKENCLILHLCNLFHMTSFH
jgi:hypothetical protein